MTVLKGRYDGRQLVLDAPVPPGIPANTRVRVVFEADSASRTRAKPKKVPSLARLKAALRAGEASSARKARVNALKLIGRPRI